jgi:hypothetical protein
LLHERARPNDGKDFAFAGTDSGSVSPGRSLPGQDMTPSDRDDQCVDEFAVSVNLRFPARGRIVQ